MFDIYKCVSYHSYDNDNNTRKALLTASILMKINFMIIYICLIYTNVYHIIPLYFENLELHFWL